MNPREMSIDQVLSYLRGATQEELLDLEEKTITELLTAYLRHYDTPFNYVPANGGTRLRCLDQSRVPERFRFLFDGRGVLTGW